MSRWRSGWSWMSGSCGGRSAVSPGLAAVRDSKDPDGPVLVMAPDDWRTLTHQVKAGSTT